MNNQAYLQVDKLKCSYGSVEVLKGVSFKVEKGETVTLLGSNGAGKTTLLKTVMGIISPKEGKVSFDGQQISGSQTHSIVQSGIVMVPEGRQIFSPFNVMENLMIGATPLKGDNQYKHLINESIERVFDLFPRLKERINQVSGTLSGGEQQMLAIGRALMSRPRILLLDEPSLGLAPIIIEDIFQVLRELNQQGLSLLIVEQNVEMALNISNRAYLLETGKIVMEGNAAELVKRDDISGIYLGKHA